MKKETVLRIAKMLSPDLVVSYYSARENSIRLSKVLREKEYKLESFINCVDKVNRILSDVDKQLLGLDWNEDKEAVIIYIKEDIPSKEYNIVVERTYLKGQYIAYELQLRFVRNKKSIYIIDNHSTSYNEGKGNASIGLKYLIKLATERNFKTITGIITFKDWERVIILERLYKEHGFDVELDHEARKGTIKWINSDYREEIKTEIYKE